jgi:hypothetical protein
MQAITSRPKCLSDLFSMTCNITNGRKLARFFIKTGNDCPAEYLGGGLLILYIEVINIGLIALPEAYVYDH